MPDDVKPDPWKDPQTPAQLEQLRQAIEVELNLLSNLQEKIEALTKPVRNHNEELQKAIAFLP